MTRVSKGKHIDITSLTAAAAAAGTDLIRVDQGGLEELKMTLTQLTTLISSTQFGSLPAAGSAMTFTVTGATDGTIGAVTSNSNSFGLATKAELEFLIETVKTNKAAIDVLRAL